jgi:hypothetical protein
MDDFLSYLADSKFSYFFRLYKIKLHAYIEDECIQRLQQLARYKEIVNIIDNLPLKHRQVVDKLFEEKKISS